MEQKPGTTHLMNLPTGAVDVKENWLAEMTGWEVSADGLTPEQQFNALVEVVQDEDGSWVEVE